MEITWPAKVARNAYVRVYATFSDLERSDPNKAWNDFVRECQAVFGVTCTEDNTVGQICQERHIKDYGNCSGGHNLYYMKSRPINERLKLKRGF